MRSVLIAVTMTLASASVPYQARALPADADPSSHADLVAGWNRWVCNAHARGFGERYSGASEWFRAGSGMSVQAHNFAYNAALRRCERRTGRNCWSNFQQDCYVERN